MIASVTLAEETRGEAVNRLCANPDCGAFFDLPGIPHLDRDTKRAVLLCRQCAASVKATGSTKYELLAIPPEVEAPEKGASE